MTFLKIRGLTKEFYGGKGEKLRALDCIDLDARKGELVTVFGPNGCGKTTLLKIISGFEEASSGTASIRNRPSAEARSYLVTQNPEESLFNWMGAIRNIAIAADGPQGLRKAEEIIQGIRVGGKGLLEFSEYYPYQLSGGLKQLAVIARALAFEPELLLLDEPFSSLDFRTAMEMEDIVLKAVGKSRRTTLFVSHNVEEAVYLADRVVVLSGQPGKVRGIIRVGLPRPRKQEMKLSAEFQGIKKELLECFGKENEARGAARS